MSLTPLSDQDLRLKHLQAELADVRRELAACRLRESAALGAAQIDPLTGLANRRLLDQQIERHLQRPAATPRLLALLFIDLDDFKAVNDTHGHAVGDAVLKVMGLRLRHAMREHDLVCRLGGDEFVCVLFDLRSEQEVEAVTRKLQDALARPCHIDTLNLAVQPSIGRALYPRDGPDIPALMAHADQAMYRHKLRARSAAATPSLAAPPAEPQQVAASRQAAARRGLALPRWLTAAAGARA